MHQRIVGMWIGTALLTLWIGVHLNDWWIPYARGTGVEREGFYRFYSSRTQILPVIGNHHPPDGGHAILDLLVLVAFVFCFAAAFANSRKPGRPKGAVKNDSSSRATPSAATQLGAPFATITPILGKDSARLSLPTVLCYADR